MIRGMKYKLKTTLLGAVIAIVLALLTACGVDSGEPETKDEVTKTQATRKPKPKFDGNAYVEEIEADFLEGMGGRQIDDMCNADNAYTHWGCFYDGLSATHESTLWIELNTDGGWSKSDQKQLSEEAARHWFNFIGPKYEKLDTIVVKVNGIDHNHYRRNFPGANR